MTFLSGKIEPVVDKDKLCRELHKHIIIILHIPNHPSFCLVIFNGIDSQRHIC